MSIQKDLERLVNEALDGMEVVRDKLSQMVELNDDLAAIVGEKATLFVQANEVLNDIYSMIEDMDA